MSAWTPNGGAAPYVVASVGLVVGLAVGVSQDRARDARDREAQQRQAEGLAHRLELRSTQIAESLRALSTSYAVQARSPVRVHAPSPRLTAIAERLPELSGLAWVARVPAAEHEAFDADAREAGLDGFCIRSPKGTCLEGTEERLVVAGVTPFAPAKLGIALDRDGPMGASVARSIEAADLLALPTETALTEGGRATTTAVWMMPVFRPDLPTDHPIGREKGWIGLLMARIDVDRMLERAAPDRLVAAIEDPSTGRLVAGSPRVGRNERAVNVALRVPGEAWTLTVLDEAHRPSPAFAWFVGLLSALPAVLAGVVMAARQEKGEPSPDQMEVRLAELAAHAQDLHQLLGVTSAEPLEPPPFDPAAEAAHLVAEMVEGRTDPSPEWMARLARATERLEADGRAPLALACRETAAVLEGTVTPDLQVRLELAERWRDVLEPIDELPPPDPSPPS